MPAGTCVGIAEPGATVALSGSGLTIPPVVADGTTGAWSVALTLADGVYALDVASVDIASNPSGPYGPFTITVDSLAPAAPVITAISQDTGTVGDFIDDVPPGHVIVLDNGGRDNATVWGDILTEVAHRRGIAGTVIDGICRDVALCTELGYPVYSRGHWMRTGKDRVQVEATNVTVNIGDARVSPGDIMRGDADGVVVLPREHEDRILETAETIQEAENGIRRAVRGGMRLDEARKSHGYHKLQSKS